MQKASDAILQAPEKNLSQQIYDQLLTMLIERELPAGTVLQERKLAAALNVSRTPTREALNRLETEGFICRQPGNSMIVREFSVRELTELLHVRALLEAEAASLAIGRISPEELDAMETGVRSILNDDDPDPVEDWKIDMLVHGGIAEAANNAVLAKMILELRLKTRMFNLTHMPERFRVGHVEHLKIIEALRAKDREGVKAAVRDHIDGVKHSIIQKLTEV